MYIVRESVIEHFKLILELNLNSVFVFLYFLLPCKKDNHFLLIPVLISEVGSRSTSTIYFNTDAFNVGEMESYFELNIFREGDLEGDCTFSKYACIGKYFKSH